MVMSYSSSQIPPEMTQNLAHCRQFLWDTGDASIAILESLHGALKVFPLGLCRVFANGWKSHTKALVAISLNPQEWSSSNAQDPTPLQSGDSAAQPQL